MGWCFRRVSRAAWRLRRSPERFLQADAQFQDLVSAGSRGDVPCIIPPACPDSPLDGTRRIPASDGRVIGGRRLGGIPEVSNKPASGCASNAVKYLETLPNLQLTSFSYITTSNSPVISSLFSSWKEAAAHFRYNLQFKHLYLRHFVGLIAES